MTMYSYTPQLRYSRLGGDPVVFDLSTIQNRIISQQTFVPVLDEDELLDYSMDSTRRGWRYSVRIEFEVGSITQDDLNLSQLWDQICDPDVELELSMNGGGRFDPCYLKAWSREPINGKNVGAHYSMVFQVKALRNRANSAGAPPVPSSPGTMEAS